MADLLDIVPVTAIETVQVANGEITVRGLRPNAIATIITRYPQIVVWLNGSANLDAKFIAALGFAFAPIIAAGCDRLGDEKYEAAAGELSIEDQLKILKTIFGLTFPNGIVSFVEMVTAMSAEGDKPIKVRLKKSPSASPPSSDGASLPTTQ